MVSYTALSVSKVMLRLYRVTLQQYTTVASEQDLKKITQILDHLWIDNSKTQQKQLAIQFSRSSIEFLARFPVYLIFHEFRFPLTLRNNNVRQ
ncbi:hypothetical protein L1887_02525 [Cichorium endivia]|nr:hypothetical protein L1887_02525 [Cichorium endivia]